MARLLRLAPFTSCISIAPIAALIGCCLAGCSSSSAGSDPPSSPTAPDGSDGLPIDVAPSGDASPDGAAAAGTTSDAAADVFASCPTSRASTGSLPADVAQVLADKCQTCHGSPTRNHAPFALLTYADTQASDPLSPYAGVPIWQVMHAVIQPVGVPHMPFGSAPQLTSSEFSTLDGWLLACAPPQ